jgi:anti-anti-sigma regulatory factor
MALLFSVRDFGTTFATRERGAELREAVLDQASAEPAVVIDFATVTHVSYSFADEFVGKLAADNRDKFDLELVNMKVSVERIVCSARQRRTGTVAC